jgi:hypothetical protein
MSIAVKGTKTIMYLEREISQVIIYTKCTKKIKYDHRYYKLKSILVCLVCGIKRDDITKLFVIANKRINN